MRRARPALLALAAAAGAWAAEGPVLEVRYQGGTPQDRAYAAAAAALKPGPLEPAALALALEAVRTTDRFQTVEATGEARPGGRLLSIRLVPWPVLEGWTWEGDPVEGRLQDLLLAELRRGSRPGALRLEAKRARAEQRLREAGYPEARLSLERRAGGTRLAVQVRLGKPARIGKVVWTGETAPYGQERLLKAMGVQPGRTLWSAALRRDGQSALRRLFLGDRRYEGVAELGWQEGALTVRLNPGPRVQIAFAGDRIRWTGVKDLLPFVRADRFTPDLLDQGDRRIQLYLQGEGYKDAKVSHRREVLAGTGEAPTEVRLTYTVQSGPRTKLQDLVFERNREIGSEELVKAARVPGGFLGMGPPAATPEVVDAVLERIRALYLRRGFIDVSLRRRLEVQEGRTRLVVQVREGDRRMVESLRLDLPAGGPWRNADLGPALFQILGEGAEPVQVEGRRGRRAERPEMAGAVGSLVEAPPVPGEALRRITLELDRPIPFVKTDAAAVLAALRQRIARLGTPRALFPRLVREEGSRGERLRVEVLDQPTFTLDRLVVQGSDDTLPEAVLRETGLTPGMPLDPERLVQAQARVGNLGAFERVDLLPLAEAGGPEPRPAWREGDLLLRLQERPHWVFSSAFGYDRTSGYHLGGGVQRLNFQGLGRTLDFNVRAGDATLHNPGLRNFFSTGTQRRSVDIYSLGYSDPWFSPGRIASWLPAHTEYRAEAAYLDEVHAPWEVRRRRVLNSLKWKPFPGTEIRLGHRFERVEVGSIVEGMSLQDLEEWLNPLTGSLKRVVISAPYLQYTRDRRDNPFDPTEGSLFYAKLELANQLWGTSKNASFVKLDLRQQWNWPVGYRAAWGVVSLGARVGVARPTDSGSEELPISERFFGGGPGSNRGVEPDFLGPTVFVPLIDPATGKIIVKDGFRQYYLVPTGGQAMAAVNLEYRFPLTPSIWFETFLDSGQVYARLNPAAGAVAAFPPWRTALGAGLIFKLGIPLKLEYGADVRRILGRSRTSLDRATELKNLLVTAGFQF